MEIDKRKLSFTTCGMYLGAAGNKVSFENDLGNQEEPLFVMHILENC